MMKPPFLNGSSSAVRLRVPSGKIRNELPDRIDAAPASIDRMRRFLVAPVDRHEAAHAKRARQDRNRVDLGLVEDVHARVQHVEQHRRIDVALVVRAVDGGAVERQVLGAGDANADAATAQGRAARRRARRCTGCPSSRKTADSSMPIGRGDEDVEGNGDVGEDGPDGSDEHAAAIINENARERLRPGGLGTRLTTAND